MTILVTGGAGFIGSHLVDKLVEQEKDIVVIDNLSFGKKENVNEKADFIKLDIQNFEKLKDVISKKKPEIIYHLAADATTKESSMGWYDPISDYEINGIGTLNLYRSVIDADINPKIVYASSAAVYGEPEYTPIDEKHPTNPISPYGISKLAGEKYAFAYFREYGVKTVVLRIFNTYGPRQPRYVMFDFLKKLRKNPRKLEILGTGEQIRDYCYVSDVVNAFILASTKEIAGEVFNVAGGDSITIRNLAELMTKQLSSNETEIFCTGKSWRGDISKLIADITKIKNKLGFEPEVSLENGILKLKEWFDEWHVKR